MTATFGIARAVDSPVYHKAYSSKNRASAFAGDGRVLHRSIGIIMSFHVCPLGVWILPVDQSHALKLNPFTVSPNVIPRAEGPNGRDRTCL